MRKLFVRLSVALFAFLVGVCAAAVWLGRTARPLADRTASQAAALTTASDPALFGPTGCNLTIPERPEEKAVRLAEEFVARNGYTDLQPDMDNLSHEGIERELNVNDLLKWRYDSLERKALGVLPNGRMGGPGWTVVFRPTLRYRCGNAVLSGQETGRAVTMDESFENLRVEHKSFALRKINKRF